ncbi:hypothetical protein AJ80_04292 [Polytolypa hystricis UAMH7299]|uniref:Uncharacterized protein n=1 Tax=Polytolypa hystricis (strain UAMH7299) TaxID=1447883 RepID=A0A2B7YCH0_POLH7|nr:hypothetical protein AJ80_04292 [Polytolypa hystricis UAMH7299]
MDGFVLQRWYKAYLKAMEEQTLTLPPHHMLEHKYSGTNNLRQHMLQHEGVSLPDQNVGGRSSLKELNEAIAFYRKVIEDAPTDEDDDDVESLPPPSPCRRRDPSPLPKPKLPYQKNGKAVNITKMKQALAGMGKTIPCSACGDAKSCCKDAAVCLLFDEFDCGEDDVV